MNGATKMLI